MLVLRRMLLLAVRWPFVMLHVLSAAVVGRGVAAGVVVVDGGVVAVVGWLYGWRLLL